MSWVIKTYTDASAGIIERVYLLKTETQAIRFSIIVDTKNNQISIKTRFRLKRNLYNMLYEETSSAKHLIDPEGYSLLKPLIYPTKLKIDDFISSVVFFPIWKLCTPASEISLDPLNDLISVLTKLSVQLNESQPFTNCITDVNQTILSIKGKSDKHKEPILTALSKVMKHYPDTCSTETKSSHPQQKPQELIFDKLFIAKNQSKLITHLSEEKKAEILEPSLTRPLVTITAYFCSTGFKISNAKTLDHYLYKRTTSSDTQIKFGFDGCGETHGILGGIFGVGATAHFTTVENKILELLKNGNKVILNCYGFSRGAWSALGLAKYLGTYPKELLSINMAVFDPVPGNSLLAAKMDCFDITLANQIKDLSSSRNLINVLALYAQHSDNSRLLSPFFYRLSPQYPRETAVEEDVIPGYHDVTVQSWQEDRIVFSCLGRNDEFNHYLIFMRILKFLQKAGTEFNLSETMSVTRSNPYSTTFHFDLIAPPSEELIRDTLIHGYQDEQKNIKEFNSHRVHASGYDPITIVTKPIGKYYNLHHKRLVEESKGTTTDCKSDPGQGDTDIQCEIIGKRIPKSGLLPQNKLKQDDYIPLLTNFLEESMLAMSTSSQTGEKGMILASYLMQLKELKSNMAEQNFDTALRNIIALLLQRDRNRCSFFYSTRGADAALKLLNTKYKKLGLHVNGTSLNWLQYGDLRAFVLGKNNASIFSCKKRNTMYKLHCESESKVKSITTDHIASFLRFSRTD